MRAVITGAASGIGRATANRFAADSVARGEGPAKLVLVDMNAGGLDEVAAEVTKAGAFAATVAGDLGDPAFATRIMATVERELGGLDVLVSNAGMLKPAPLNTLPVEDFDRMFAVNARPTWLLSKLAYEMLKASHGCIVATVSVAGEEPCPPQGAYSASKAAQLMLVRQIAFEWAKDGIRCNCVSPGTTMTQMTKAYADDPELYKRRAAGVPLGRLGRPEDLAGAISFLAGPDASFITGSNLVVDGGLQQTLIPASGSSIGFVK